MERGDVTLRHTSAARGSVESGLARGLHRISLGGQGKIGFKPKGRVLCVPMLPPVKFTPRQSPLATNVQFGMASARLAALVTLRQLFAPERRHWPELTMPKPIADRAAMIAGMTPELRPDRFVFVALGDAPVSEAMRNGALSFFREAEGISVLLPVALAKEEGLSVEMPMRQITLQVYSSLAGVGLTAAVSTALGAADIPCNMIAAALHDHVFVPEDMAAKALDILVGLAASSR